MCDLPKEYDIIIAGTGLTESILSAALSRIGKIVLHIDRNQFYGGEFSSHSLASLIEWIEQINTNETQYASSNKCNNNLKNFFKENHYEWNSNLAEESKNEILKLSRRFSMDLAPNVFYSRGQFIELLISSDVSKYCEFRMVNQILTRNESRIEKVPTSRSEVFKTNQLSMIEKRVMMQFIQSCMKDNNFQDFFASTNDAEQTTFKAFIQSKKFSKSIENYLLNAVAMSNETQTALDGLKQVKRFLDSVGRFGDSPFLFSLYGTGELPQCFCRMSAVFGGIYHLSLTLDSLNLVDGSVESVDTKSNTETNSYKCKHLVMDCTYAPLEYLDLNNEKNTEISRCVLITNKSLFPTEDQFENISLLYLGKSNLNQSEIYLIEASSASQCCPKGYNLVYLFCDKVNQTAQQDFEGVINDLFTFELNDGKSDDAEEASKNENEKIKKPSILFSHYYTHLNTNTLIERTTTSKLPNNLLLVGGSRVQLDLDYHVEQAKLLFEKICPNEQFLPRPPDQEDIIFGDEATSQEATNTESINVEVNNPEESPSNLDK